MTLVILWRYDVRAGCEAEFEEAYGPSGAWATLFARGDGFGGTTLLREEASGRYVTLDRWSSEAAHAAFLAGHGVEYDELDRRCALLTVAEEQLGRFVELDARPAP